MLWHSIATQKIMGHIGKPKNYVIIKKYIMEQMNSDNSNYSTTEGKDWLTTLLLCLFLGNIGIHRFYTGHIGIGVAQVLTLGGCGIWTIVDLIFIATDKFKDINGNALVKK